MKKKKIIIILIVIAILTFVIPIRKETKREIVSDTNPPGLFFGGGFTTVETFNVYYNIYGVQIMKFSTGEVEEIG